MNDHELIDAMRVQRTLLEPSTAELARMRAAANHLFTATEPGRRRTRRPARRSVRMSFVAVVVATIVVAAGVAFGPGTSVTRNPVSLPAPANASAAFNQAAASAGDASWTPLGRDDYFHTLSSTFDPKIPPRAADPAEQVAGMYRYGGNSSTEYWLDSSGHGRAIVARGGLGDPDLFPHLTRHPRTGLVNGFGGYVDRRGRQVDNPPARSAQSQVRFPDTVDVIDRPRHTTQGTATMWFRQPSGYISDGARPHDRGGRTGAPGASSQVDIWGAPLAELQRLDTVRGARLRAAVRELVDERDADAPAYPLTGSYDVTADSQASSARIRRTIKLLGSAPLAPRARQELFRVLASEPHGTLTATAKDQLGRTGTRVTFETVYDKDLPARRLSGAAAWRLAGGTGPVPRSVSDHYDLPAYHAFRRWYVDVIFDRESGELLQYAYYSRWRSNGLIPRLTGPYNKPSGIAFRRGESQGETDSGIFVTRARSTEIVPSAPVCKVDPTPCAPSPEALPAR